MSNDDICGGICHFNWYEQTKWKLNFTLEKNRGALFFLPTLVLCEVFNSILKCIQSDIFDMLVPLSIILHTDFVLYSYETVVYVMAFER